MPEHAQQPAQVSRGEQAAIASDDTLMRIGRKRHFDAGQYILLEGEQADSLFLILSGSVSVLMEEESGEQTVLSHMFTGDLFGEMCLCSDDEERSACVVAREPTEALKISYTGFLKAASVEPELWLRLVQQLSGQLRQTSHRVRLLAQCNVTQRIANLLRDLAAKPFAVQDDGATLLKISRRELANMAGCSREMVSRSLQELSRTGLISFDGLKIRVTALLD